MSLHVFLDIRLLGKGTATGNALEGFLTSVAAGNKACQQWRCALNPGAHGHQEAQTEHLDVAGNHSDTMRTSLLAEADRPETGRP